MSERLRVEICVPHQHPALAGHFPGAPVAPGVLLLDLLLQAAQAHTGRALEPVQIPQVKFIAPLLPGQPAHALLEIEGARLTFRLEHAGRGIASGTLLLGAA